MARFGDQYTENYHISRSSLYIDDALLLAVALRENSILPRSHRENIHRKKLLGVCHDNCFHDSQLHLLILDPQHESSRV